MALLMEIPRTGNLSGALDKVGKEPILGLKLKL